MEERVLVIGAHALDFLWRCGGTIAQYTQNGSQVHIINLTYGERGESNDLWKKDPQITEEEVIAVRRKESESAAGILGATISFMGWKDHMLFNGQERALELAEQIKVYQPTIILTHFEKDTINPDHATAYRIVTDAVRLSKTYGVLPHLKTLQAVKVYMFEPSHPELFGYVPDVFIDITDVIEIKKRAMTVAAAQEYLQKPYVNRADYRGHAAGRIGGDKGIRQAESFRRCMPYVGKFLV